MIKLHIITKRMNFLPHKSPPTPPASHIFLEVPGKCATDAHQKSPLDAVVVGLKATLWEKPFPRSITASYILLFRHYSWVISKLLLSCPKITHQLVLTLNSP